MLLSLEKPYYKVVLVYKPRLYIPRCCTPVDRLHPLVYLVVRLHLLDEFCELVGHLHPVLTGGDEGRQQQPGLAGVRGIFDEGRLQRLQ